MNRQELTKIKNDTYPQLIERLEKDGFVIDGEDIYPDGDFYKKQKRIVLRNCNVIDPASIEEYIARDGYFALEKCLNEMSREEIIDTVKNPVLEDAVARDSLREESGKRHSFKQSRRNI